MCGPLPELDLLFPVALPDVTEIGAPNERVRVNLCGVYSPVFSAEIFVPLVADLVARLVGILMASSASCGGTLFLLRGGIVAER